MTTWMREAWALVGQRELTGAGANPEIVALFREAGHADIVSDETAWCAAFVSACLARAGLPHPKGYAALRAAGFENYGQELGVDDLRSGAIVVIRARGDGRHVGFCAGADARNVMLLGGNQADAVNVTPFRREAVVAVRWPGAAVTASELKATGSRTVTGADAIKADGAKAAAVQAAGQAPNPFPADPGAIAGQAREAMGWADTAADFARFVGGKWPWLMALLTVYLLARMAWRAGWITAWRVEDHNSGANQARAATAEGNHVEAH